MSARSRCAAALTPAASALVLAACTLTEVVTPEAEDLLVVEAVLRADLPNQRILLHRSLIGGAARPEPGAEVVITRTSDGTVIGFVETEFLELCVEELDVLSSCYVSAGETSDWIRPGEEYELGIRTADGLRAFGRTRVPGDFRLTVPPPSTEGVCRLLPETPLLLSWTRSAGAWSYLAELELTGLQFALGDRDLGEFPDRVLLTGLAISEADTTMTVPGDFGVFQRTEFDQPFLVAIRDGLPRHVGARLALAAVDRNFVNAVRGGVFNPSGRVRIPSVAGDATGVFGSMVVHRVILDVREESPFASCTDGS